MYYLCYDAGSFGRIRYTGSLPPYGGVAPTVTPPNQAPVVTNATVSAKVAKLKQKLTFTISAYDPENKALMYGWDFGDGTGSFAATTAVTKAYTDTGIYAAAPYVKDVKGAVTFGATILIQVGDPNTVKITSPSASTKFKANDIIKFSGTATSPKGVTIPAENLKWTIQIVHDDHVHPLLTATGNSGQFQVDTSGHDTEGNTGILFILMTEGYGVNGMSQLMLWPQEVNFTVSTVPSGLSFESNGIAFLAPHVLDALVGFHYPISVAEVQCKGDTEYKFAAWSNSADREQVFVMGTSSASLIATFIPTGNSCDGRPTQPPPWSVSTLPASSTSRAPTTTTTTKTTTTITTKSTTKSTTTTTTTSASSKNRRTPAPTTSTTTTTTTTTTKTRKRQANDVVTDPPAAASSSTTTLSSKPASPSPPPPAPVTAASSTPPPPSSSSSSSSYISTSSSSGSDATTTVYPSTSGKDGTSAFTTLSLTTRSLPPVSWVGSFVHFIGDSIADSPAQHVTAWADDSTNHNDVQMPQGYATYSNSLNAHRYVQFRKHTGFGMFRGTVKGAPTGNDDRSIFMVVRYAESQYGGFYWGSPSCNKARDFLIG